MRGNFGPWATPINAGTNPQLSSFWRQRMRKLAPASQTSPVISRRHLLWLGAAGVLTGVLPTFQLAPAADDAGGNANIMLEQFAKLSEDRQKKMLLDAVQRNRQKYANLSLKTTSRVKKADVDPDTIKAAKILEDFGRFDFELRRIDGSFRMAYALYRPGKQEPSTRQIDHYDAKSGVSRGMGTMKLAGQDRLFGRISKEYSGTEDCRYVSYLGGLTMFQGFSENDFLGFLLDHKDSLRIRGIDQQNGFIEAHFTYKPDDSPRGSGSCTMWFDIGKDWLLTRRVWLREDSREKAHERFEVNQSKKFDGLWMPVRFTETTWASSKAINDSNGNVRETTAEDIKIGHVKKEDLEVVFPAGAMVQDEITGEKWGVGKSGEKIPYDDAVGAGP